MKSPFSYQNQFSQSTVRHKRLADVVAAHEPARNASPARKAALNAAGGRNDAGGTVRDFASVKKPLFRQTNLHDMRAHIPVVSKKRGLDGIRTEKPALLNQFKTRSAKDVLWRFFRKTELYFRFVKRTVIRLTPEIAPHKMLYGSLIGGVAFGIVSMGFIEHFFGPGVFARSLPEQTVVTEVVTTVERVAALPEENTDGGQVDYSGGSDIFFEYFNEAADEKYKEDVREMVKGYPIEAMLPYIFEQDRLTVAFLIGIAKKESNWGKRVPVLDDQDCFNYWGYRGIRRMMGTGGHTCFNSRQDAVETVAKRLNTLIHSEELNTPEKMIVWKCGFSCNGHSRESVKKWISDVDMYFGRAGGDE